ncbi:MAG: hypothetical protein ABFD89_06775 [Bryobacteraceae bacterium]
MSNKPAIPVKTALVKQFNKEHRQFMAANLAAGPLMVKAINKGRALGILLKDLLGRENITENCVRDWLRDNPRSLCETQVGWLMNFVRISNKVQGELKLFGEAPREVVQMTMQCAGLLPADCGREEDQMRHEPNPISMVWKSLADMRIKFDGLIKSSPKWDDETRCVVIRDIEKAEAYLEEVKEQVSRPELKRIGGFVEHPK